MLPFTIRQYQSSDHDQVMKLHKIALEDIGAFIVTSDEWDKDLNDIEGNYIHNKGDFLVGLLENKIIAMGAIRKLTEDTAELKRMRVHPDFQRQGFGQQMLEALENRAKELGYKTMQLDTLLKQNAAWHLYEKNGYSRLKKETWDIHGKPYQVVVYNKKL